MTHNINEKGDVLLASFEYNELGELVDKKLHVSGSTGLQSIDYRYNIRGWLTHINNSKLTSDNGLTNDDTNDFFGMEFIYNGTMGDFPMTAYNPFQNPYPFDFHNPSSVMLASNESQYPPNAWASINRPAKSTTEDLIREANERIEAHLKENKNITSEFKVAADDSIIGEKGTGAINPLENKAFEFSEAVTFGGDAPAAPTNFLVSTGGTNSLKLEWEDNADNETGYMVERLNDGNWQVVANLPANATSYIVKGLPENTTVQVRVKAVNEGAESGYIQVSGTTSRHVPGAFAFEPQFNGNIAGVKWANNGGSSQKQEKAYVYSYDAANRLKTSSYAVRNPVGGQLDRGGFNENLTYDHNGNILSLQRSGLAPVATLIDDLSYNKYIGNRLYQVTDQSTNHAGFKDGNTSGDDYDYDKNGNMIADKNKGVDSIKYNHLNLPEEIKFRGGRKIEYIYDAAGTKLGQRVTEPGKPVKETWYVGEIIYENEANKPKELVLIHHEEGRIVPDPMSLGNYEYQYHIKDHLGNVRVTFTSKPKTHTYALNYESSIGNPDLENFSETGNLHKDQETQNFNYTPGGQYSQLLTGAPKAKIGSVIALAVGAGDTISAKVRVKYKDGSQNNNPVAAIAPLLLASLNGTSGSAMIDGNSSGITNSYGSSSILSNASYGWEINQSAPRAFINLLFIPDKPQSSIDKADFVFKQISTNANQAHETLEINDFIIKEKGVVIVYLSNENLTFKEVFFDDLEISIKENAVVQTDDYYPFGLTFNSFKRVTDTENRFLYNQGTGEKTFYTERIMDLDLNIDMTKFRMYDYVLGRFMQTDPQADLAELISYTPYNYSFNNPVRWNDPLGDCPPCNPVANTVMGELQKKADYVVNKVNHLLGGDKSTSDKKDDGSFGPKTQVKLYGGGDGSVIETDKPSPKLHTDVLDMKDLPSVPGEGLKKLKGLSGFLTDFSEFLSFIDKFIDGDVNNKAKENDSLRENERLEEYKFVNYESDSVNYRSTTDVNTGEFIRSLNTLEKKQGTNEWVRRTTN